MNDIINKFLLVGVKFMPEMHLSQPEITYSACGQTGDSIYVYKNELRKGCFQHDMAYGYFKDLKRITVADNVLRDKPSFNIAKNPKYDGY